MSRFIPWLALLAFACRPSAEAPRQYLADVEFAVNAATGEAAMSHLVVFNPGPRPAALHVTCYFTDRAPTSFVLAARAQASTESNAAQWPVPPGSRFGMSVESDQPVLCQLTAGWNNTGNRFDAAATSPAGAPAREVAVSYFAARTLLREACLADGYQLEAPGLTWLREREWLVVLNPGTHPAHLTLEASIEGATRRREVSVAAGRVARFAAADWLPPQTHYGLRVRSDQPVAAQWRREVFTYEDQLLTAWSLPLTACP